MIHHILVPLSDAQTMLGILQSYTDRGPTGEGWKSDELEALVVRLDGLVGATMKTLGAFEFAAELLRRAADEVEARIVGVDISRTTVDVHIQTVGRRTWRHTVSRVEIEQAVNQQWLLDDILGKARSAAKMVAKDEDGNP